MIIYNVTVNIEKAFNDEWLHWMKTVHIPEVMSTGCFTENRMFKIITDEEQEDVSYSIQYSCTSMMEYENYRDVFAPALQASHTAKFKDKFVAFRTLLEKTD